MHVKFYFGLTENFNIVVINSFFSTLNQINTYNQCKSLFKLMDFNYSIHQKKLTKFDHKILLSNHIFSQKLLILPGKF